ncbi:hypothetical protein [Brevundimonas sp. PAMC22021]|uniref:hypothetical protein n=1 Tax=Brevundimonas sp. PAMC22021 TaxID=2861285 RepID=UPI001C62EA24|nr:hypothetical protein [Brevundimonas sp. PAMC22021]QYF86977.1 hypothetical protein KY493_00130 [Brevundimonas sp. PAMC22021]
MIRTALIAVLSAVGVSATQQQDAQPLRSPTPHLGFRAPRIGGPELSLIRFSLEARADGAAQLGLTFDGDAQERRGTMSGPRDWSDLHGVSREALTMTEGPVAFTLYAAAGDLACSGVASAGMAAGHCNFDPDEAFAATLEARLGARPGTGQLFHLALTDFDPVLLDALEGEGYARPDLDQVVAAAIHGVDAVYVRDVARSGYRLGALDALVAFRIHGVTPEYVADMEALGAAFRGLPAEDLMALSIHGVGPEYVRAMSGLNLGGSPKEMVALKIHGVTAEGVRALAEAGYGDLTAEQQLAFAIHDVTPGFIHEMAGVGYAELSADQLVSLRIHGVTPDYARRMERHGAPRRTVADAD